MREPREVALVRVPAQHRAVDSRARAPIASHSIDPRVELGDAVVVVPGRSQDDGAVAEPVDIGGSSQHTASVREPRSVSAPTPPADRRRSGRGRPRYVTNATRASLLNADDAVGDARESGRTPAGRGPGTSRRGSLASDFIRSCVRRFDAASSVWAIGAWASRFS